MGLLLSIARFEVAYQLRQPAFYLFAFLILGQGVWYTAQVTTLYSYTDPTLTTYLTLASLGVMVAIAAVLLAGQSLTKDLDYRTTPYLFSLPITSQMHFAGRFMGTYATVLLLAIFYPLGILLALSVNGNSLPSPWMALVDGYVRLVAQNVFIVVSLTFSLTVFLRSIQGAYISLFLVVLYFLLTESSVNLIADSDLWQLLDPFGVGMARESVENRVFSDDPQGLLAFSDMFFINRLLWLGLSLGLLAYAERNFSFAVFASPKPEKPTDAGDSIHLQPIPINLPSVQTRFGKWLSWQTTARLAKMEFLNLIRQPVFLLTLGLLMVLAVLLLTVLNQNPDFPELPITSRMTALRLPMGLFTGIFLLVMTGELIFQERTVGFWPIYDALPQPSSVLLLAKLLALTGAAALLTIGLFLTGVGVQVSSGFSDIDWTRYTADLLTDGFLRYCQLIALGAVVASLTNNRFLSHLICLLSFALLAFSNQLVGTKPTIYLYSFLPGSAAYSDLIGYGLLTAVRPLFHVMWWGVAGVFLTSFILTWNRGVAMPLSQRIGQWRARFSWPYQLALVVFGSLLSWSFWQTQQHLIATQTAPVAHQYTTRTTTIPSVSGRPIAVHLHYNHPYQIPHILQAVQTAMHQGELLFGEYPFADLSITETPTGTPNVVSKPGQILIAEKQGWTADYHQPDKLDYIDYLIGREVFKQWLVHRLQPASRAGDGFIRQSLPDYLALQTVGRHYGPERLHQRLSQRAVWYAQSRQRSQSPEPVPLQSSQNDAVERGRAVLALNSIDQVWGAKPLSFTISQFYLKAIKQPRYATASAFADELTRQLPDSLDYLKSYLNEPLWFDFKVGHIANLSNGLTVEIIAAKWRENKSGQRQPVHINDYVPLVVLDQNDRILYHELAHPNPDERYVYLPAFPNAYKVVIDPLGAWLEPNKHDNGKIL